MSQRAASARGERLRSVTRQDDQTVRAADQARGPARLPAPGPIVMPSLLLCDFGNLAREIERLEAAGARALHLDVMDGRFVPQLTYGPVVCEAVRRAATVPIEVHLMIEDPARTVDHYLDLGADCITVHIEAVDDVEAVLAAIRRRGAVAHLSLNPSTPLSRVEPHLEHCDGVLVMSVEPGFGGQAFLPVALEKLSRLSEMRRRSGLSFRIGVDGGISASTIAAAAKAGAELLVAGSAVIRSGDYQAAIHTLEHLAREAA